mmetsp:Transcript_7470/g.19453  ORF Transcript_7470/g.19453 Transcript_7470/m.19453 type:complete len:442 (+) Transcript_7470:2-1327(+)
MIYPIFVPSRVQRVASRMRPFELKEFTEFAPGSAVATAALGVVQRLPIRLLSLFLALFSTALTVTFILVPMAGNMEIAKHILCSGDVDFVYAVAPDTGVVFATRVHSPSDDNAWDDVIEQTILQFTGLHDYLHESDIGTQLISDYWPQDTSAGIMYNTDTSVADGMELWTGYEFIKTMSTSDVQSSTWLARCEDFSRRETNQDSLAVKAFLKDATGGLVDSCAGGEDAGIAGWYSMTRFRGLCPETSGCSKVWLFFSHPRWGCPGECFSDNRIDQPFSDMLKIASCVDDSTETWRTEAIVEYVSGFSQYVQKRPGFWARLTSTSTSAIIQGVISAYEDATGSTSNQTVASVQESIWHGITFERMAQGIYELAPGLPMYTSDGVELVGCALWTDAVFQDILSLNLCSTLYHQSIAFMCPERCRCQSSWQQSCPSRCSTSTFG